MIEQLNKILLKHTTMLVRRLCACFRLLVCLLKGRSVSWTGASDWCIRNVLVTTYIRSSQLFFVFKIFLRIIVLIVEGDGYHKGYLSGKWQAILVIAVWSIWHSVSLVSHPMEKVWNPFNISSLIDLPVLLRDFLPNWFSELSIGTTSCRPFS